jgi:predicted GNAT family acetyltransferase
MTVQIANRQTQPIVTQSGSTLIVTLKVEDQSEVLSFLSRRPEHTFVMAGLIHDNGLVSELNRGTFLGHRDAKGELDGVALIGHISVFETANEEALATFAQLMQRCPSIHAVIGEAAKIRSFLSHYEVNGAPHWLFCREQLFEKRRSEKIEESVTGLRLATLDDLDLVVPVHAQMAFEECGVNPLFTDSEGFYRRCARRIEQKRVWVKIENNQLTFKADIITETPDITYLEGVYVNDKNRGKGLGAKCLKNLTNELLKATRSVCLLVNEHNTSARACYQKAGYEVREVYDTLFFRPVQEPSLH